MDAPRYLFGEPDHLSDCEPGVLSEALTLASQFAQLPRSSQILLLDVAANLGAIARRRPAVAPRRVVVCFPSRRATAS